jgi:hypothetical protein
VSAKAQLLLSLTGLLLLLLALVMALLLLVVLLLLHLWWVSGVLWQVLQQLQLVALMEQPALAPSPLHQAAQDWPLLFF